MQARSCSTRLTGIYDYTGKVKGKAWKGKNVLQRSSSKDDDLMLLEDIDSDFLRKTNVKGLDFTGCYLVVADLPDLCRLVEMLPSCEVVILRGCNVKTARADNLQKLLLIPHLRFLDVSLTTLASAIRIDLYKCLEDHDFDKLIFIDNPEQLSRPGWRVLVHPELQPRVIKTHQAYFTSYPSKIRSRNVLEIPEWGSWGLVPPLLGPIFVKRRSPGISIETTVLDGITLRFGFDTSIYQITVREYPSLALSSWPRMYRDEFATNAHTSVSYCTRISMKILWSTRVRCGTSLTVLSVLSMAVLSTMVAGVLVFSVPWYTELRALSVLMLRVLAHSIWLKPASGAPRTMAITWRDRLRRGVAVRRVAIGRRHRLCERLCRCESEFFLQILCACDFLCTSSLEATVVNGEAIIHDREQVWERMAAPARLSISWTRTIRQ
eukprot:m.177774 g.177774  ORF g.177774 m.177774 type:complete len:436 (+) comp9976_c0_seq1:59-1366(+)